MIYLTPASSGPIHGRQAWQGRIPQLCPLSRDEFWGKAWHFSP